jgi:hypothetical protein
MKTQAAYPYPDWWPFAAATGLVLSSDQIAHLKQAMTTDCDCRFCQRYRRFVEDETKRASSDYINSPITALPAPSGTWRNIKCGPDCHCEVCRAVAEGYGRPETFLAELEAQEAFGALQRTVTVLSSGSGYGERDTVMIGSADDGCSEPGIDYLSINRDVSA